MAAAGIGAELEGVHAVLAAVRAGRVDHIYLGKGRGRDVTTTALLEEAERRAVPVQLVDDVHAFASTSAPQGVAARARPIPTLSIEEAAHSSDPAALVVLDRVEDPRNVGAIARSALAAGVSAMIVSSDRAAPLGAAAFKAAAGSLEELGICPVTSIAAAVRQLKKHQIWIIGVAGDGAASILGLDLLTEPVALVVGSESRGLSRLVRDEADVLARIPMVGEVESLNVSVAAALAMFEMARVRAWLSGGEPDRG